MRNYLLIATFVLWLFIL